MKYDGVPGGGDEEEIEESDFTKDANVSAYEPGGTIDYGISFTLLDDLSGTNEIKITDTYQSGKLSFVTGSDVLKIGTTTLTRGTHYTLTNSAGVLTI